MECLWLKPAPLEKADRWAATFRMRSGWPRASPGTMPRVPAGRPVGRGGSRDLLSNVVNYLRTMNPHPAYERVSAADSSRASFLNHNRYPGSVNNTIDYYDKGMLIAFDVDAALRLVGKTDLDREMRPSTRARSARATGTHRQRLSPSS